MKSILRISIICMLMLGIAISLDSNTTSAQPPKTKFNGYRSGVQVANLENSEANITLTGYKEDGTQEEGSNDTIAPNGSKTYVGARTPLPVSDDFSGAIIISSNTQTAAISNILDSGANAYASYVGRSAGAETIYLPLLTKNFGGFTTWYSVQNAGGSPAEITITYSDGIERTETIQPSFAQVFYQSEEDHEDGAFAATITSNQPIIAAVIQESDKIIFSYTGFTAGTPSPVFPLVNQNNGGYRTGLQIQNIGTEETSVTLEYVPGRAGTSCEETASIAPGASATFALRAFQGLSLTHGGTTTCIKERFVGSAQVKTNSANQDLVGIGNQLLPGINGEAYGSFSADDATNVVVMPLIMDRRGGFNTGIAIQHVGGPESSVTCTFSDEGTASDIVDTLAPGDSFTAGQRNKIEEGFAGSGVCTADNTSTKIVAVVNQVKASTTQDLFLVYEGAAVSN